MKSPSIPNPSHPARPLPSARSWRFYAAITFGVALLVGVGTLATLWIVRQSLISKYTARSPKPIPVAEVRSEDRQALNSKWGLFLADIDARRPTAPLTMSASEVNVFLSMIPPIKDRFHASIEGSLLRIEFSMPLDEVGMKGRYANGVGLVGLKLDADRVARLELVSAKLNGKEVPQWLRKQINLHREKNRDLDLVQRVLSDAKIGRYLESIEIRDGMVVFNPANRMSR